MPHTSDAQLAGTVPFAVSTEGLVMRFVAARAVWAPISGEKTDPMRAAMRKPVRERKKKPGLRVEVMLLQ